MSTMSTTSARAPSAGAGPAGVPGTPGTEREHLVADDGRHLAATWAEPIDGPPRAIAVVSSATGVPRGYYRAFATWLAGRGYAVLTYDYRGIGGSRRGPPSALRSEPATMRDWATLDMSAALAAAEARRETRRGSQRLPLLLVGHSFGGNAIAFARGVERADALLSVGSQLGEPRLFPGVHGLVARFFFDAWLPTVLRARGHVPGWALGPSAQPLPPGAAQTWIEWSRLRGWAYADPRMQPHRAVSAVVAPVHLWSVSDDLTYGPPAAVDALAAQFRNAAVQRHTLRPHDVGAKRLGHFGAFRRAPGAALWRRLLAPIEAASPSLRAAALEPLA
ncbi:MAG: alpha/beta hydrolase [Rubrivivax sp.]|nr:alpha/beta hydrolase [Rubrivivax sp.]